jgi:hypothetical protein
MIELLVITATARCALVVAVDSEGGGTPTGEKKRLLFFKRSL